ncbi:uncharacterized protein Tco025E_05633 [Trypanosoma conorhini]|uniref:Uncharacterized protein n=1 Tax=Trypanosoma conorhini TaxID=83891 RepID=A0A422PBU4_9TRYP|nr:uncharacterized protein Tco025E_05633 [Trypanosoma conorhini]RNF15184.1 hypothetical protein Tco025E_05633 [Trypanosoma conorhini]
MSHGVGRWSCLRPLLQHGAGYVAPLRPVCRLAAGGVRRTRVLLRPQTIKPNPAHTPSGKFDRSFEKLSGELENRMPFRQQQILFGSKYDHNFGEESYEALKQAAQDDIYGREPEKAAAQQARSYFTGDDLSPTALHVKSPLLKVAQLQQRQKYDKKILKTSQEPTEYYYHREAPARRRARHRVMAVGAAVGLGAAWWGLRRLRRYMLE